MAGDDRRTGSSGGATVALELAITVAPGVPVELWLIEARAPGYDTGAVVLASGATLEFVLVPRLPGTR